MAWIVVCGTSGCLWRHVEAAASAAHGAKAHHEAVNPSHQVQMVWDGQPNQDWLAPVTFGRRSPAYSVRGETA